MSVSITPALQVLPTPAPTPAAIADQRRADKIADTTTVREVATDAIESQPEHAPVGKPAAKPGGKPGGKVAPPVVAVVNTSRGAATVQVWDVNGDGAKDAVVRDVSTGVATALINRGENDAPVLDSQTVSLTLPVATDLDKLAVEGPRTGREFLATDTTGEGLRQIAVKRGPGDWLSLGGRQDVAGDPPAAAIDDAEARFEQIVLELCNLVYSFAWARSFSRMQGQRMTLSAGSALSAGGFDLHAFNGYDTDNRSLGLTLLGDPFLSVVASFAPEDWGFDDDVSDDATDEADESDDEAASRGSRRKGGSKLPDGRP